MTDEDAAVIGRGLAARHLNRLDQSGRIQRKSQIRLEAERVMKAARELRNALNDLSLPMRNCLCRILLDPRLSRPDSGRHQGRRLIGIPKMDPWDRSIFAVFTPAWEQGVRQLEDAAAKVLERTPRDKGGRSPRLKDPTYMIEQEDLALECRELLKFLGVSASSHRDGKLVELVKLTHLAATASTEAKGVFDGSRAEDAVESVPKREREYLNLIPPLDGNFPPFR